MSLPTLSGTGRLYADPDLRFGSTGTAVAKIPLAFNSRRKNQQTGDWEDGDSYFITGTLFGDRAEAAVEALQRGAEVVVSGRLKTRQWEQDGEKRSMPELMIDSIGPTVRAVTKKTDRATVVPPDPRSQQATAGVRRQTDEPPF